MKEISKMRHLASRIAVVAATAVLALALVPSIASAQMREFTGRIDKINKKQMIVDNRMGDKVKFMFAKGETVVEGKKTDWGKLKTKDWVTVSWKFVDKPRKAYKVLVFDKKEDEGEEVD